MTTEEEEEEERRAEENTRAEVDVVFPPPLQCDGTVFGMSDHKQKHEREEALFGSLRF